MTDLLVATSVALLLFKIGFKTAESRVEVNTRPIFGSLREGALYRESRLLAGVLKWSAVCHKLTLPNKQPSSFERLSSAAPARQLEPEAGEFFEFMGERVEATDERYDIARPPYGSLLGLGVA